PRLRSRLVGGLSLEIAPAKPETRRIVLEQFALERGIALSKPAVAQLAEADVPTVRELLGAVVQLDAAAQLQGRTLHPEDVQRWNQPAKPVSERQLPHIAKKTAKYFQVTLKDLTGRSRRKSIVHARGAAIYQARKLTGLSHQRNGRYIGGRDHSTALYACRIMQEKLNADPATALAITTLQNQLQQHPEPWKTR
ncbi:MAG: DnaA/Hda family protein, partial [Planctomycetales bacterium]